jgi:hypothetical protein
MSKATICCVAAAALLLVPAASASAATSVSSNWSGYVVMPKSSRTKYETVSGTWVVPQGDCSSGAGYEATWVGIGGYRSSSRALEQTGTEFDCRPDGTAKYSAWYELVPAAGHDIDMTVRPGDTIDAAVTVNRSRATLYLRNRTRGSVFRRTFTMKAPDTSSAEWIVEAPSECNTAPASACSSRSATSARPRSATRRRPAPAARAARSPARAGRTRRSR